MFSVFFLSNLLPIMCRHHLLSLSTFTFPVQASLLCLLQGQQQQPLHQFSYFQSIFNLVLHNRAKLILSSMLQFLSLPLLDPLFFFYRFKHKNMDCFTNSCITLGQKPCLSFLYYSSFGICAVEASTSKIFKILEDMKLSYSFLYSSNV